MEAIIFTGIQGTGKSTFFKERFADTHVRINLDMLRTRYRETVLLHTLIQIKQRFVVDNTNPTAEERARYIVPAREAGFRIIGYYFQSRLKDALLRNALREAKQRIPDAGVRGTAGRLQIPTWSEGYDELYYVRIAGKGRFTVNPWADPKPGTPP